MNLTDHCVERYFQRTRRKSIKRFKKLLMEKKDEIIKYDIYSNHFHTNYVRNVVQMISIRSCGIYHQNNCI